MTIIKILTVDDIIEINRVVCANVKQKSVCMDRGKVDSALGAAFYPGDYPFSYGGIPKVAGALCYFLIKAHAFMDGNKRTGVLASTLFLDLNGYELVYPLKIKTGITALTEIVEKTAISQISKEQLVDWFDVHKKKYRE